MTSFSPDYFEKKFEREEPARKRFQEFCRNNNYKDLISFLCEHDAPEESLHAMDLVKYSDIAQFIPGLGPSKIQSLPHTVKNTSAYTRIINLHLNPFM